MQLLRTPRPPPLPPPCCVAALLVQVAAPGGSHAVHLAAKLASCVHLCTPRPVHPHGCSGLIVVGCCDLAAWHIIITANFPVIYLWRWR